jgi:hypothetical protein
MKQIQIYDYYLLGKALEPLFLVKPETLVNDAGFDGLAACKQLKHVIKEDSIFLPGTRRAAAALVAHLVKQFGDGIQDGMPVFWDTESTATMGDDAEGIVRAVTNFDTLLDSDSPRMAVFSVEKKGIYQTADLIDHADQHLPEAARKRLPKQAKTDLIAAGRCLAFNIPTSSAFHAWRALEIVFGAYFVSITGKTFEEATIRRNWGEYIKALNDAGADKEITRNLDHIRAEYRNPIMHPNDNLTADAAFSLMGIAFSAIAQVMQAIDSQPFASKALN